MNPMLYTRKTPQPNTKPMKITLETFRHQKSKYTTPDDNKITKITNGE